MHTLVLYPYVKRAALVRSVDAELEEAVGLARAIDLDVSYAATVGLSAAKPATLFGSGKVEEIGALIAEQEIELVVVGDALSPIQQRNLERSWKCKVIDRTALILEIFGARARTAEGKLQVELASLNYQKTRLVRSWTHLERQRGGFGFLGGPGESQIEIDRRLIRDRIAKIKKELSQVVRTRALHRASRVKVPYPIVALVGYTNAGKSTLFNRATGAKVMAEDVLFATLDPTMRALKLPSGAKVILSDTVGFVSNLPHELVAAFRATLEEVLEADIILHVRDISHPDTEAQKKAVEDVLADLFDDESEAWRKRMIEVGNKMDVLEANGEEYMAPGKNIVPVSALTGAGVDRLMQIVDDTLHSLLTVERRMILPASEGRALAWLHQHGQVTSKQLEGEELHVCVRLTPQKLAQFEHLHALKPALH